MSNEDFTKQANEWVRRHQKELFEFAIKSSGYDIAIVEATPAATFMAGTPGAGKTEVSKRFVEEFAVRPIRIDADEFRSQIPGYTGSNSSIIQSAATTAVQKVLDHSFAKNYSFVLDGTFGYKNAMMNLKRAYRHGYSLQILFIYQDPVAAWNFTKIREKKEGRHVPVDVFIEAYFNARNNVKMAKKEFGSVVNLTLVTKDYVSGMEAVTANIDDIDNHLGKIYTKDELKGLLQ